MTVVYDTDERDGITYAYEVEKWYDDEIDMTLSRRNLIGRVDEQTGQIVPVPVVRRAARHMAAQTALSDAGSVRTTSVRTQGTSMTDRAMSPSSEPTAQLWTAAPSPPRQPGARDLPRTGDRHQEAQRFVPGRASGVAGMRAARVPDVARPPQVRSMRMVHLREVDYTTRDIGQAQMLLSEACAALDSQVHEMERAFSELQRAVPRIKRR